MAAAASSAAAASCSAAAASYDAAGGHMMPQVELRPQQPYRINTSILEVL